MAQPIRRSAFDRALAVYSFVCLTLGAIPGVDVLVRWLTGGK
jgi:hypothetical protein